MVLVGRSWGAHPVYPVLVHALNPSPAIVGVVIIDGLADAPDSDQPPNESLDPMLEAEANEDWDIPPEQEVSRWVINFISRTAKYPIHGVY